MEGDDIFMNAIIDLSHTYLETDRLLLRSWNENDVDDFLHMLQLRVLERQQDGSIKVRKNHK